MAKPMKRSQINSIIEGAKLFTNEQNFMLPPWAFWKPSDWKGRYNLCHEIIDNMLGWDVTSFSSDDFHKRGLIAFTIRNGNLSDGNKPYCEKIIVVEEDQETPWHYHDVKVEDIINRSGGNLVIELRSSTSDGEFGKDPVQVQVDSISRTVDSGGKVILEPGMSICLEQRMYHRFYGETGKGKVLVGEVSAVNDDKTDNRFYKPLDRFPGVEEDEEPVHLMVNDYQKYL